MKLVHLMGQIGILALISAIGNFLAKLLPLGMPGGIYGIILLLTLIQLRIIPLERIERGAEFLLAELLLFFIPSAIGVIEFKEVLSGALAQLLAVLSFSILLLLGLVGLVAELALRLREGGRIG